MTKILKRPLSIILAVLMVMSVFIAVPMTASAAEETITVNSGTDKLSNHGIQNLHYGDHSDFNGNGLPWGTFVAPTGKVFTKIVTNGTDDAMNWTGSAERVDHDGMMGEHYIDFDTDEDGFRPFTISFTLAPATPTASTAAELTAAIANAQDGDTIKLTADINDTTVRSTDDSRFAYYIAGKSVTIDGDGHTVTLGGRGFGVAGAADNVTFKNITIKNTASSGRAIDTRGGNLAKLTFDNVTLECTNGASQALTIGGNQAATTTVDIQNSSISARYAITTFNPVAMTIDASTITGWACLNIKAADSSAGSAGSTFTVTNSTLTSKNPFGGATNSYAAIKIEDDNVTVDITGTEININGEKNTQAIVACQTLNFTKPSNDTVTLGAGNTVTFEGDTEFISVTPSDSTGIKVSAGTFNAPVPEEYCAEGMIPATLDEATGTYSVKTGSYVAQIGSTKYETLAEAFAAAQNGDTVKLLENVTLSESLEIPAEKSFTLDLNGKDITGNVNDKLVKNYGTVVVDDTSAAPGHIYNTNIEKQGNAAFVNYGTATVKNGYFGDKNSDMTDANDVNRGAGFQNEGTAVIKGGYFTACDNFTPAEQGNNGYAYAIINYGDITINDATVYGKNNGNLANDEGTMVVNGGTYTLTLGEKKNYYSIYNGSADAHTTVNDGTFKNGATALTYTGEGTMDIKDGNFTFNKLEQSTGNSSIFGGTFSKRVESRCCAEGYIAVENSDGTFGVAQDDNPLNSLLRKASEIADSNLFKLNNDYYCGTLLGVQKKAAISGTSKTSEDGKQEAAEGNDMRFVAVLETNLLRKADDYGFVLAKVGSGKNTTNTNFDNLKANFGNGEKTVSAKGTYNNIMIKNAKNGLNYGDPAANTAYKYVTCAVNGVSTTEKVVARFYVTINGKTYYAKYAGHDYQYTGCTAGVNSKGNIV